MSRRPVRARSDVERLARTRILIGSAGIYLLSMAFMTLGDLVYAGSRHIVYTRLATLPFFLLLLRIWMRYVRVRPPEILTEARRLVTLGRYRAAREKLGDVLKLGPATRRLDRARHLLQDGLAVSVAQEALLETGRCSLLLGETERAAKELAEVAEQVPRRADAALDLADALARQGRSEEAARVLRLAVPWMDAMDTESLRNKPGLLGLLGDAPLPRRSAFYPKVVRERILLGILLVVALVHALHLYVGLY